MLPPTRPSNLPNHYPQYLDFLDCTGGGDVDTSKAATKSADGTLTGLSGRTLALGPWADGVDSFKVGAVRLWDLLPTSVLRRVKKERKAAFETLQHRTETATQQKLDAVKAGKLDDGAGGVVEMTASEKKEYVKDTELQVRYVTWCSVV